ncbi:MAG: LysM peptidoglycan-binding domain-containing protein, partial [Anaerolineae bacterium]|nr:LysM peptidoglycan-binding domain-containing protein [Anaerolineae bacterium]
MASISPQRGPARRPARACPVCGTRVSQRADTCFMCGAALAVRPRRSLAIPWADIVLFLVIAGVVAIWWTRPGPAAEIAVAPTNTPPVPPTATATSLPPPTPTATSTALPTPTPTPITYIVKLGDIPEFIARKHGITVEALLAANNLTEKSIIH